MDQFLEKQTVTGIRPIPEIGAEWEVAGEFLLPEYCPDVAAVLKCCMTPRLRSYRVSGDTLTGEGVADIRVLYLDEERHCVRVAEFSQSFSGTLSCPGGEEAGALTVTAETGFVNCRAASPRRLEIRGSASVRCSGECRARTELLCPPEAGGDGLYARTGTFPVSRLIAAAEKSLTLSETLPFDDGMPPAEQLLGGTCSASVTECKLLTGKVIVKGQADLHLLYTDDGAAGSTHALDYVIPYSQILDMDGAAEGCLCTADVTVTAETHRCIPGADGGQNAVEWAAKLLVQVRLYEKAEIDAVLDVYHTGCPVSPAWEEVSLCSVTDTRFLPVSVQKSVELPTDDWQEILDVWVQPLGMSGTLTDGKARLSGRMLLCLLVRGADGTVSYFERPEECETEFAAEGDGVQASFTVRHWDVSASGDRLDLRVELAVTAVCRKQVSCRAVSGLTVQTDDPYPACRAAVRLYYAEPGESVWDIARRCHTDPRAVMQENGLSDDAVTASAPLIIPAV